MPETLILEFAGTDPGLYNTVNGLLGIDPASQTGDVPAGLIHHQGAATADGGIIVVEVWESQEAQAAFMESRLGPALGQAGVAEPKRVEWASTLGLIEPW